MAHHPAPPLPSSGRRESPADAPPRGGALPHPVANQPAVPHRDLTSGVPGHQAPPPRGAFARHRPVTGPTQTPAARDHGAMRTHTAITALAAATLLTLTSCGSSDPADGVEATIMCEKFVKQKLKSPGSAEFSSTSETTVTTISGTAPWKYQVAGHVDSQNSFGAKVRNTYDCTASTPDGETWTLDKLDMSKN